MAKPIEVRNNQNKTLQFGSHSCGQRVNANIICGCDQQDDKFHPRAQIKRWGDDDEVSIEFLDLNPSFTETVEDDKLILAHATREIHMYMQSDSAFEFGVLLKNGFNHNSTFRFKLNNYQDYDVLYQDDWSALPGATIVNHEGADGIEPHYKLDYSDPNIPGDVHVFYRPVGMCHGYLLRNKTKQNHQSGGINYGTGVACSIRQFVYIDEGGAGSNRYVVEADVYDVNTGIFTIPAPPREWLKNAVGDIFLDPTIGVTDETGSSSSNSNRMWGWLLPAMPELGTPTSMHLYRGASTGTRDATMYLYTESGTSPNDLHITSDEITGDTVTAEWKTFTLTSPADLANATQYWLCHQWSNTTTTHWFSDAANDRGSKVNTYGSPPDPFGSFDATANARLCSYVTYTASGGGGVELTVPGMLSSSSIDEIGIIQSNTISPNEMSLSTLIDGVTLSQQNILDSGDIVSSSLMDGVVLSVSVNLDVGDMASESSIDNVSLIQQSSLAVNDISIESSFDAIELSQQSSVDVAAMSVASLMENVALSSSGLMQVPNMVSSGFIDGVALTQQNVIIIPSLSVSTSIDPVTLAQQSSLIANSMISGVSIGGVELNTGLVLSVNDLLSASSVGEVQLIQASTLSVSDMNSASLFDNVGLLQGFSLSVDGMLSASQFENVELSSSLVLAIQDMLSGVDMEALELTEQAVLNVGDLNLSIGMDNISLSGGVFIGRNVILIGESDRIATIAASRVASIGEQTRIAKVTE